MAAMTPLTYEIIGDQHQSSPAVSPIAEVFESRNQDWGRDSWIVARRDRDPLALVPTMRVVLGEMDSLMPIAPTETLRDPGHDVTFVRRGANRSDNARFCCGPSEDSTADRQAGRCVAPVSSLYRLALLARHRTSFVDELRSGQFSFGIDPFGEIHRQCSVEGRAYKERNRSRSPSENGEACWMSSQSVS
jgi:hypothetical protein